jgi:aryl-alcohol dehydrogenase-like predicted oxidoreductase
MFTENFDISQMKPHDARLGLPRFQGEHLENNKLLVRELTHLANAKGLTTTQLALAWVLAQGHDIIPIPGTKRRKYLDLNAESVEVHLTKEDITEIEAVMAKYPNVGERYDQEALKLTNR